MVELATITAVLAASKTGVATLTGATDLIKKLRGGDPSTTEIQQLVADLSAQLMEARMNAVEIQNQLLELRQQAQTEDQYKAKRDLYVYAELPGGGRILKLKTGEDYLENAEVVCPICAEKDRLFLPLQKLNTAYKCVSCDSNFRFKAPDRGLASAPRGRRM